jgi:hypothetical protein
LIHAFFPVPVGIEALSEMEHGVLSGFVVEVLRRLFEMFWNKCKCYLGQGI